MYLLIGPPCSGKTTLGDALSKETGFPHIVASSLLKNRDFTQISDSAADAVQVDIIMNRLLERDCAHGFVLDNFPRTAKQAELLDSALQRNRWKGVSCVFDIEVPVKTLEARAGDRRVDPSTGLPVKTESTSESEACDEAEVQGEVVHKSSEATTATHNVQDTPVRRSDDAPEHFQHRLERYGKNISGLRSFYGPERCQPLTGTVDKHVILARALSIIREKGNGVAKDADPLVASQQIHETSRAQTYGHSPGPYNGRFVEAVPAQDTPALHMAAMLRRSSGSAQRPDPDQQWQALPGQLIVETLGGTTYTVNTNGVATVGELKEKIKRRTEIPVKEQSLVVGVQKLEDSDPVPEGRVTLVRQKAAAKPEYEELQQILEDLQERLKAQRSQLQVFTQEVNSPANWTENPHRQPCGCCTVTKRYTGRDPGRMGLHVDLYGQVKTDVTKVRTRLDGIYTQQLHKHRHREELRFEKRAQDQGMNAFTKFFQSILFFTCEAGFPQKDEEWLTLEAACKSVLSTAEAFRSDLTSRTLQAATKTNTTQCEACRLASEAARAAMAPGSP
jgi:adenylate kinase family enzyme